MTCMREPRHKNKQTHCKSPMYNASNAPCPPAAPLTEETPGVVPPEYPLLNAPGLLPSAED